MKLTINGDAVSESLELDRAGLASLAAANQAIDTIAWDPKRPGRGVLLEALLQAAGIQPEAEYITLHASRDDFHASVSLAAVRGRSCVVYDLFNEPLPEEKGGPFRFMIRDPDSCQLGEVDDCANVKHLDRIEISRTRGQDTRPQTETQHQELHNR